MFEDILVKPIKNSIFNKNLGFLPAMSANKIVTLSIKLIVKGLNLRTFGTVICAESPLFRGSSPFAVAWPASWLPLAFGGCPWPTAGVLLLRVAKNGRLKLMNEDFKCKQMIYLGLSVRLDDKITFLY